jgi:alpha-1,2-glucosyltransferase
MLCPLLFFFSALYYTDVLSAFVVMEAYRWYVYLGKSQDQSRYPSSKYSVHTLSSMSGVAIFLLGLFAMLVRQTNVFWVAVFLGGLQAVRTLTSCTHPAPSMASQKVPVSVNWTTIYDSPMQNVAVERT